MRTADFCYDLPPELIAQTPAARRDGSRLMVLDRAHGTVEHRQFIDFPSYWQAGDVLILNDSRVIPARLRGVNHLSGGQFEVLLLEENGANDWWAMLRPGKRARMGTRIDILRLNGPKSPISAVVTGINAEGHRRLTFSGITDIRQALDDLGEIPLPPYIERQHPDQLAADKVRYQTVYAGPPGSVAAPTAGLHFTPEMLDQIRDRGVRVCRVTLHVGLGTFAPVKADRLEDHVMHEEWMEISPETAAAVQAAKAAGRRVVAAGTTSVRVLESAAALYGGTVRAHRGRTRIFIYPPYTFKAVDALLTNFHLPCSTLLMLVGAFAAPGAETGRRLILDAYAEAVRQRYRFFSYGDAMLIR